MMIQRFLSNWIHICIACNVAVFFMWQNLSRTFMFKNFAISWTGLMQHRYWTLFTSVFSHAELWHLAINMYVLHSFGTLLERVMGRTQFWTFYLAAGLLGSLCHAGFSQFLMNQPNLPAVGASGAIAGLILIFALKFPQQKILLMGIIPVPALMGALGFVAYDLYGLFSQTQGGSSSIGHGAHLGGALAGALYFFLKMR